MHQKPLSGGAPPGPTGGAHTRFRRWIAGGIRTPRDWRGMEKGEGDRLGRGKGEGRGGGQRRRIVPRFISLEPSTHGHEPKSKNI